MFGKIRALLIFLTAIYTVFGSPIAANNSQDVVNVGSKVINGTLARPEQTKYQVSVRLRKLDWSFGAGHICGGSLIAPSLVLTAAHCLYNYQLKIMRTASDFIVAMGSTDRYDRDNSTVFDVAEIVYKDSFNISTFVDDIAILILNGSVPENQRNIETIAMNWNSVPDDTVCQVTGWGVTEDGYTSDLLMTLKLPIVNHTLCAINYEGFVRDGMICAGYMEGMRDACSGDSGGPLVCNGKLTGIVSFGSGCALPGYPGVYTEVRYHSDWIKQLTGGAYALRSSMLMGWLFTIVTYVFLF